jgi:hypothetical protein
VPPDYFGHGELPAIVQSPSLPPPKKSRWPAAVAIGAGAVAVALALGVFVKGRAAETATSTAPAGAAVDARRAASPPATAAPLVAKKVSSTQPREVVLAVEPLDAHVFQGDTDLGPSPVKLEIPNGQRVELEIRHSGYKPEKLAIDGSEPRKVVQLERVRRSATSAVTPRAASSDPMNAASKRRPSLGSSEIVNPWPH